MPTKVGDTSPSVAAPRRDADNPRPSVGAVIINFNGGDKVFHCLRALSRQSAPLASILVVDNGSTDGSAERIRADFPNVDVLALGENRGLPAARNAGLARTESDLVLLLDNDIYPVEDCVHRMLLSHEGDRETVLCPRILLFEERETVQCDGAAAHFTGTMVLRHGYRRAEDLPTRTTEVGACPGGCLLFHRESVLAAGGFDEAYFFYLEDLEFSLRLRALGFRLLCDASAVVLHDRGSGTPGLSFRGSGTYPARRAFLTLRNRLMTMLIHYRIRTLAVLLPALVLYEFASFGIVLARGWPAEWARAWAWQFRNAKRIWKRRQEAQQSRVVDDKGLLVGGPIPFAPGFLNSRLEKVVSSGLSSIVAGYWRATRGLIG